MHQLFSNRRLVLLTIILIVSNLLITGVSLIVIYQKSISGLRASLIDIVERQKSLVTVLHEQGKSGPEIIQMIKALREKHYRIGQSGEFAIACKNNDSVEYLLSQEEKLSFKFDNAEGLGLPMQMALKGKNGDLVALDYRGMRVLAAYTYVPALQWGLVAKIPTSEVYHPYYKAILITLVISILLISVCVLLFAKISNPIITGIINSEIHYRSLFENDYICMLVINPYTQKIVDANPAACKYYGYKRNTLVSMNISQISASVPTDMFEQNLKKVQTGQQNRFILKHKLSNGLVRDVDLITGTIRIKGEELLYSIIYDITERKQVEEALLESEERFSKAYMTSPIAFMIANMEDGKIIEVNEAFTNISGFTREEALASSTLNLSIWVHEKDRQHMIATLRSGRAVVRQETMLRGKTGNVLTVLLSAQVIQLSHKNCIISSIENITERKQSELLLKEKNEEIETQNEEYLQLNEELRQTNDELQIAKEKAEESDRLKSAFLQNMSHEIRTPMNAIMGFSQLLVKNYDNKPKLEKFSEIINQRCNDLLEIINDILDIAKIESGQLSVNIEACNLDDLFTELTTFFKEYQKRIGKEQIKFSLQALCIPSENTILTDKIKLKQILINLIGNAFKFTDEGEIEGGCKFDTNDNLIFYVSDTGIGIPPDKQELIFERFVQLKHEKGGTGLGLSVVKGLVDLLGGKIWLESEPENLPAGKAGGTTFYFSIPYKISQSMHQEPVLIDEIQAYHFPGKTILVVEDDLYNVAFIKEILSETGINIIHSINGSEAVQMAVSQLPDLILLDIRLPDMDGYEALRQIKKLRPELKIIAQTAYAAQEDRQKAFSAGCIDYISKPLDSNLLLSMIKKHL